MAKTLKKVNDLIEWEEYVVLDWGVRLSVETAEKLKICISTLINDDVVSNVCKDD